MNGKIVSIGTELLLGEITDTNTSYIAERLALYGINVYRFSTVGDNGKRLASLLESEFKDADMVITTGGLGPTDDDLSKESACEYFGEKLVLHEDILKSIENYFSRTGRKMTDNNKKQAYLPKNCTVMYNKKGTAPGFILEKGGKTLIMLPGPPHEMRPMFDEYVIPYLESISGKHIFSRNMYIYGLSESAVESKIKDIVNEKSSISLSTYAGIGETRIRVALASENEIAAYNVIDSVVNRITDIIGKEYIYGIDVCNMQTALVKLLIEKKLKIATAESCTGGFISKKITEVSGSSSVFECGICSYGNNIKEKVLGVRRQTLEKYGAVSFQTAKEMAQGVLKLSGADIGVSVTGIAGPTGGTKEKPVGLVYIAAATKDTTEVLECYFGNRNNTDREYIRTLSCLKAINLAIQTAKKL